MSVDKFGRHSSGQMYTEPGVSVRYVNNNFIRRDGSNEVEGDLSMNTHKITNLSEPTEAQDAATRGYVKNFTRNNFLKLDGTNNMEGDLNVDNHKIINLSDPVDDGDVINKSYLESTTNTFLRRDGSDSMGGDLNLSNNKIVNVANPTSDHDVVNKAYADFVARPVITIWGEYEWSFGNGEYIHAQCGYCMPSIGWIIRGNMTDSPNSGPSPTAIVDITINGQRTRRGITKTNIDYSNTTVFSPSIEVAQNYRINFKTVIDTPNAVNNIVSLLIKVRSINNES